MNNSLWYTFGRVVSPPTEHQSKDGKAYNTVYVELFGGMRASALAGTHQLSKGDYVGVKITPRAKGQAAYNVVPLNDAAQEMIIGAALFIDTPARVEHDEELPF